MYNSRVDAFVYPSFSDGRTREASVYVNYVCNVMHCMISIYN